MTHPEFCRQSRNPSSSHPALWLKRRELLATAFGALLVGCRNEPDNIPPSPNDPRLPIGDAHVHLFNGADLPVEGFFKYVLIPAYLSDWPNVGLALVDITRLMKKFCKTAAEEYEYLKAARSPGDEMSPEDFAEEVIKRADEVIDARPTTNRFQPQAELGDSYIALARLIAIEDARYKELPSRR